MAHKKNDMPKGPGGRGRPRPKLENPKATLARVLKFVGKNYWLT